MNSKKKEGKNQTMNETAGKDVAKASVSKDTQDISGAVAVIQEVAKAVVAQGVAKAVVAQGIDKVVPVQDVSKAVAIQDIQDIAKAAVAQEVAKAAVAQGIAKVVPVQDVAKTVAVIQEIAKTVAAQDVAKAAATVYTEAGRDLYEKELTNRFDSLSKMIEETQDLQTVQTILEELVALNTDYSQIAEKAASIAEMARKRMKDLEISSPKKKPKKDE